MSNEDQIADLLDGLAANAPQPDLDDLNQRIATASRNPATVQAGSGKQKRSVSRQASSRQAWWLVAAAVALAATIGLTQLLGSDPVELAIASFPNSAEEPEQTIRSWLASGEREIVIWADNDSTPGQRAAIEEYLAERLLVERSSAVSRADIFEEFQEYWRDEPEIIAAVGPEDLPYRIDVTLSDNTTTENGMFLEQVRTLDGVDSVGYIDTSSN